MPSVRGSSECGPWHLPCLDHHIVHFVADMKGFESLKMLIKSTRLMKLTNSTEWTDLIECGHNLMRRKLWMDVGGRIGFCRVFGAAIIRQQQAVRYDLAAQAQCGYCTRRWLQGLEEPYLVIIRTHTLLGSSSWGSHDRSRWQHAVSTPPKVRSLVL